MLFSLWEWDAMDFGAYCEGMSSLLSSLPFSNRNIGIPLDTLRILGLLSRVLYTDGDLYGGDRTLSPAMRWGSSGLIFVIPISEFVSMGPDTVSAVLAPCSSDLPSGILFVQVRNPLGKLKKKSSVVAQGEEK
jgi:hypothetical protein